MLSTVLVLLDFNVLVPRESDVGFTCWMTGFLFNFSFQWYPITYIASVLFPRELARGVEDRSLASGQGNSCALGCIYLMAPIFQQVVFCIIR